MLTALRRGLPGLLVLVVLALSWANAARFSAWVANPLAHADSWYFVDAFLEPWDAGELSWREFFVKRGQDDHAQPLHRLALLWNAETQSLDFAFEARIGLAGLSACLLLLLGLSLLHLRAAGVRLRALSVPLALSLALLPAAAFSLNSHEIYYWSLVAFFYVSLLPALGLMAWVCWQSIAPARPAEGAPAKAPQRPAVHWLQLMLSWLLTVLGCIVVQVALDGAGMLVVAALLAVLFASVLLGSSWRRCAGLGMALLIGLVAYRWTYAALFPDIGAGAGGGAWAAVQVLLQRWDEAVQWLLLPAGSALVHPTHLQIWFPDGGAIALQWFSGSIGLVLHAAFWISWWRQRAHVPLARFAAALMLLSYGMVLGILLSRVPQFGTDYLLQMRYIAFYQLATIAMILQMLVVLSRRTDTGVKARRSQVLVFVLAFAFFGLQYALTERAWQHGVHIRQYSLSMARNLLCLADHPGLQTPQCVPGLGACDYPMDVRERLLGLLEHRQLNLFAPGFLETHDMQSAAGATTCLLPSP